MVFSLSHLLSLRHTLLHHGEHQQYDPNLARLNPEDNKIPFLTRITCSASLKTVSVQVITAPEGTAIQVVDASVGGGSWAPYGLLAAYIAGQISCVGMLFVASVHFMLSMLEIV